VKSERAAYELATGFICQHQRETPRLWVDLSNEKKTYFVLSCKEFINRSNFFKCKRCLVNFFFLFIFERNFIFIKQLVKVIFLKQ